ncbi:MAG: flagellar motor switch protein FliN [Sphingobacteriia bacterium]|nr:flagellar motor switch protein FliN [Sphingobacteriia bacterium]NCC39007.1 flagellar motor switch protein FliN [Gammaproteobacteria bacterium]
MTDHLDDLDDDWAAAIRELTAGGIPSGAPDARPPREDPTPRARVAQTDEPTFSASPAGQPPPGETPRRPREPPATVNTGMAANDLELVLDIPVMLTAELGRRKMPIRQLLELVPGAVVDLDGNSADPINVLINGTLVAKGEVVVINDKLGVRLTDIISPAERMLRIHG